MHSVRLSFAVGLGLVLGSAAASAEDESARSHPKDRRPYWRLAIPSEAPRQRAEEAEEHRGSPVHIIRVVDTVVNNTDPNLKNTDTFNDRETSIAVNPRDPDDITISAFSGGWGATAPFWRSTDNGRTWTKLFTIPFPPGVAGTLGCPCDQTFDYGKNNALFGTFLTVSPDNIYSGSPMNPPSAAARSWWTVPSIAQPTNLPAHSVGRADQPWLVFNRGTTKRHSEHSEHFERSEHSEHG